MSKYDHCLWDLLLRHYLVYLSLVVGQTNNAPKKTFKRLPVLFIFIDNFQCGAGCENKGFIMSLLQEASE
jgi:hypothetical protein